MATLSKANQCDGSGKVPDRKWYAYPKHEYRGDCGICHRTVKLDGHGMARRHIDWRKVAGDAR